MNRLDKQVQSETEREDLISRTDNSVDIESVVGAAELESTCSVWQNKVVFVFNIIVIGRVVFSFTTTIKALCRH